MDSNKAFIKKLFNILYYVVLALLVVALGVTLLNICSQNSKVTSVMGYTPTIVISGSMEPEIKTNALCFIKIGGFEDTELGDIIVYDGGLGRYIVHRVVKIDNDNDGRYLITKGDANSVDDGVYIYNDKFIGKIVYIGNWAAPIVGNFVDGYSFNTTLAVKFTTYIIICIWLFVILVYILLKIIKNYLSLRKE